MAIAEVEMASAGAAGIKTPQTRLMDMLAGWGRFLDGSTVPDAPKIKARVWDLVSEAGALGLSEGRDATDDEIVYFVGARVVPLLLDR